MKETTQKKSSSDQPSDLYSSDDYTRRVPVEIGGTVGRGEFDRDHARLVHSPSFRRLAGKTQLFPNHEGDFFRNRLTHSLEVAQVARTLARKFNGDRDGPILASGNEISIPLIEFAALAHDIGHPPFGHNGEEALDEFMRKDGGFEGNAQTLRIVGRLEKRELLNESEAPYHDGKDNRIGLNLTARALASVIKYPRIIPAERDGERSVKKGIYECDKDILDHAFGSVFGASAVGDDAPRSIECAIMDISDDIAYSTYDLEDALKCGILRPTDMLGADLEVLTNVARTVERRARVFFDKADYSVSTRDVLIVLRKTFDELFRLLRSLDGDEEGAFFEEFDKDPENHPLRTVPGASSALASNGYLRSQFTSRLVNEFVEATSFRAHPDGGLRRGSVQMDEDAYIKMEVIKNFVFESVILSTEFQVAKYRGKKIVTEICEAVFGESREDGYLKREGFLLLPGDFKSLFKACERDKEARKRVICDFVAGMTDSYAAEFHRRLFSWDPPTVQKPV